VKGILDNYHYTKFEYKSQIVRLIPTPLLILDVVRFFKKYYFYQFNNSRLSCQCRCYKDKNKKEW